METWTFTLVTRTNEEEGGAGSTYAVEAHNEAMAHQIALQMFLRDDMPERDADVLTLERYPGAPPVGSRFNWHLVRPDGTDFEVTTHSGFGLEPATQRVRLWDSWSLFWLSSDDSLPAAVRFRSAIVHGRTLRHAVAAMVRQSDDVPETVRAGGEEGLLAWWYTTKVEAGTLHALPATVGLGSADDLFRDHAAMRTAPDGACRDTTASECTNTGAGSAPS